MLDVEILHIMENSDWLICRPGQLGGSVGLRSSIFVRATSRIIVFCRWDRYGIKRNSRFKIYCSKRSLNRRHFIAQSNELKRISWWRGHMAAELWKQSVTDRRISAQSKLSVGGWERMMPGWSLNRLENLLNDKFYCSRQQLPQVWWGFVYCLKFGRMNYASSKVGYPWILNLSRLDK